MLFQSRKDNLFKIMMIVIFTLFTFIIYTVLSKEITLNSDYITVGFIIVILFFLFWTFYTTKYIISATHFKYKSGFIKGTIELKDIHTIVKNKTMWVGLVKPATAQNGLIIKHNKFDKLYISPNTNDTFIAEILKHNSEIKIES